LLWQRQRSSNKAGAARPQQGQALDRQTLARLPPTVAGIMNKMDSRAKNELRKTLLKEFFRFNKPNFYLYGFVALLAALFFLAITDEYSCSTAPIYGKVVSFRAGSFGGYANFRSLGVRHEAEIRLQTGEAIYINKGNFTIGEEVTFRACKSGTLKLSKYEQIYVSR
jgi:hypothetical protein